MEVCPLNYNYGGLLGLITGPTLHLMAEATKPSNSLAKNECQWTNCVDKGPYSTVQDLVDHVKDTHLSLFVTEEFVLCLWEGCKVYNIPCQNKSWLPQHMRRHTNERPHKCIMNGCNMSFWNPDSLQNHLQLHLEPSPPKVKKKSQKRTFMSGSHISDTLSGSCNLPKKMCSNDLSTLSDDDSSSQSDFRKFERKRPLCLKVKIPLHSSIKFSSVPLTSPVPIPINGELLRTVYRLLNTIIIIFLGGVIHDDIIDLKTMSVIQSTVVTRLLQSSHDRISRKDSVCLNGKVSIIHTNSSTVLCSVLYYTVLCSVLYYTVLYCTILYYTVLYYTVLYCTILYYTVLYYAILYCTVHSVFFINIRLNCTLIIDKGVT